MGIPAGRPHTLGAPRLRADAGVRGGDPALAHLETTDDEHLVMSRLRRSDPSVRRHILLIALCNHEWPDHVGQLSREGEFTGRIEMAVIDQLIGLWEQRSIHQRDAGGFGDLTRQLLIPSHCGLDGMSAASNGMTVDL